MKTENDTYREAFRDEANELLAELETSLLELEESPEDGELVGKVFRAMHTIKGSGSMFGFDDIARFTHEVETVFDHVRNGDIPVTGKLVDLTLRARDCIRMMLESSYSGETIDRAFVSETASLFKRLLPRSESTEKRAVDKGRQAGEAPTMTTYRVRFRPSRDIFRSGTNPLLLINELSELGTFRVLAQRDSIPSISDMDPESCYVWWDMLLTTDAAVDTIRDVFIFVDGSSEVSVEAIVDDEEHETGPLKLLGQILVERGDVREEEIEEVLKDKKPIGELLVDAGLVSRDKIESALAEQAHVREVQEKRRKEEAVSSIRVAAEKLDKLVDLVGELVTVQARLSEKSIMMNDPELLLIAEEVEHLTEELRDNTMSIRMIPIGSTFGRFKRLVRDLSRELGKEIELVTEGAETELDKTVIEKLNDPLVHIIRNSIDHGIEAPEARSALGKPATGTIQLSAGYAGANVVITIRDDGAGLDKEAIRKKAAEKGLVPRDAELCDRDVYSLIFAPGFSMAKKVTSVSGRGVGMDVVKKTLDSLRGVIEVESTKGAGTCITLRLPLTLAIIDGLLVNVDDGFFVLPLSIVEECIELSRQDIERAHGRRLVNLRGQVVPYMRLRETFMMRGNAPDIEQVIIAEANGIRMGFAVDQVVGEHQTVIKSLGKAYKGIKGISGATIMGDGSVALILDVAALAILAQNEAA